MKIPNGPHRSNCFAWALGRWWKKGGYVAFRWSRNSPWLLHFLWSATGRYWWGYTPMKPKHGWAALMHGISFRGDVKLEKRENHEA